MCRRVMLFGGKFIHGTNTKKSLWDIKNLYKIILGWDKIVELQGDVRRDAEIRLQDVVFGDGKFDKAELHIKKLVKKE